MEQTANTNTKSRTFLIAAIAVLLLASLALGGWLLWSNGFLEGIIPGGTDQSQETQDDDLNIGVGPKMAFLLPEDALAQVSEENENIITITRIGEPIDMVVTFQEQTQTAAEVTNKYILQEEDRLKATDIDEVEINSFPGTITELKFSDDEVVTVMILVYPDREIYIETVGSKADRGPVLTDIADSIRLEAV